MFALTAASLIPVNWAGNWSVTTTRVSLSGETYEPADTYLLSLHLAGRDSATGTLINTGRSLTPLANVSIGSLSTAAPAFYVSGETLGVLNGRLDFKSVGPNPTAVGTLNGKNYSLRIVGDGEVEVIVREGDTELTVYRGLNLSGRGEPAYGTRMIAVWVSVVLFTGAMTVRRAQLQASPAAKEKTD
jgi:hypothetical protein